MLMKFTVKQIITSYTKVGEDYQLVEVAQRYTCNNYDDLQNLLLTIIESSDEKVRFEVSKEELKHE